MTISQNIKVKPIHKSSEKVKMREHCRGHSRKRRRSVKSRRRTSKRKAPKRRRAAAVAPVVIDSRISQPKRTENQERKLVMPFVKYLEKFKAEHPTWPKERVVREGARMWKRMARKFFKIRPDNKQ